MESASSPLHVQAFKALGNKFKRLFDVLQTDAVSSVRFALRSITSTKNKMQIARILNSTIVRSRSWFGPVADVVRRGINWRLAVNEGIKSAVYNYIRPPLSANMGAHGIPMARRVGPKGKVMVIARNSLKDRGR
jgi:hypothetical protein